MALNAPYAHPRPLRNAGSPHRSRAKILPMPLRRWTRGKILSAIHERRTRGLLLQVSQVKREDIALYSAAGYYFGSWARALRAAGIPAPPRKTWKRKKLARILKGLDRRGGFAGGARLDAESKRVGADLRHLVQKRFGSLRAARAKLKLAPRRPPPVWPREKVLRELRQLAEGGLVRYSVVKRTHPRLLGAIDRRFGSWGAGLAAAKLSSTTKWSREEVLRTLRLAWEDRDIRVNSLKYRFGGGIYIAAVQEFGSWRSALKTAGVPSWVTATRMSSRRAFLEH